MAWIESHQSLGKHRKLLRLAGLLGVGRAQAVGHLHYLWWWALDNVPINGRMGDITAYELAAAAEWNEDPDAFVHALIEAGFVDKLDDGLRLHDWEQYAGALIASRQAKAEAGVRGNHERWHVARGIVDPNCRYCAAQSELSRTISPPESGTESHSDRGAITPQSRPESHNYRKISHPTQPNHIEDDDDARAREAELWAEFRRRFFEAFGGLPNNTHYEEVDQFLREGMELAAIVEAVRTAALNKASGWGYVRRILQNWLKDELLTVEQIRAKDRRAQQTTRASPSPPSRDSDLSWIEAEMERIRRERDAQREVEAS